MFSIESSGYYAWAKQKYSKRRQANQILDKKIVSIFTQHHGRYGSPRLTDELHEKQENCSKNRVARRMKFLGLRAKGKRKFRITTDSNHDFAVSANVINRNFSATTINQKWVGDMTYVWTDEGWVYLAVVIDLYSRAVIGWSIQPTMTSELVCDAFKMALARRDYPSGMVFHSDRGSQYCSAIYKNLLAQYSAVSSMSRKANCWDNAVSESFFHSLKTELIHGEKYATRALAKESIFQYIEVYYNRIRRHSTIGSIAPMTYENQCKIAA